MISRPVVLVLGAGASADFGFPLGQDLIKQIAHGGAQTDAILEGLGFHGNHIRDFRTELRKAAPPSIDEFLAYRKEYLSVGKAAIATRLVELEKPNSLLSQKTWYKYLLNAIVQPTSPADIANGNLSVITFNYDRSLEFWLLQTFAARFGKTRDECLKVLQKLGIYHVYGSLGCIPGLGPDQNAREYTPNLNIEDVRRAASSILIVHEEEDDNEIMQKVYRTLFYAHSVVFLGFGFHAMSLGQLQLERWCRNRDQGHSHDAKIAAGLGIPRSASLAGTSYGFTESEENHNVRRHLQPCTIQLQRKKVLDFLRDNLQYFLKS